MEELERIVGRIRKRWPGVEIWLRGDSGFCRDELLAWCEAQGVEYVLGIAQNPRLKQRLAAEDVATPPRPLFQIRSIKPATLTKKPSNKIQGANPRFVVTSLGPETMAARALYELPC